MYHTLRARIGVSMAAAALGLSGAACSDDAGTETETVADDAGDGDASDGPVGTTSTIAAEPAAGEAIVIGFLNSEGGAFSVPELRVGNELAQDYINEQLGGVNGRPLRVLRCATDGTPEKSIDCVNGFVEEGVVAVLEGADLGADAVLPILTDAGIPMIGHVQFGPARMFDANAFYLGAAAIAYGAAALTYYADADAETVAWFLPDEPSSHVFTDDVLIPTAEALGIEYKTVYYDAMNPNWAVLAATAVSESPDVSGSIAATDAQCAEFIAALRDAGYQGRILAASCTDLYDAVGDKAVGVDTQADHWHVGDVESAPPAKQDELLEYAAVMDAAGQGELIEGNAIIAFADMINLSRILSTIDEPVDGAAVSAAFMATKDFDSYTGPTITCDHTVIPGNSACSTDMLFFQVQDDGSIKAATPDFVDVSGLVG